MNLFSSLAFYYQLFCTFACIEQKNIEIMAKITIPYAVSDFVEMRERGFLLC